MTVDYRETFVASLAFHLLILTWAGARFVHAPKFEMARGSSEIGVELVEKAPKEVEVLNPFHEHKIEEPPPVIPKRDDLVIPKPHPKPKARPSAEPEISPAATLAPSASAPVQRSDTGPARGHPDGFTSASAAYYRNPPPAYPRQAREQHIEGIVHLLVSVDPEGEPAAVKLKLSSGSGILDQAALDAVGHWRFKPAMLLSRPVSSEVEIPIRFKLEK